MNNPFTMMSGFGNDFESEVYLGALPQGRNSPQNCQFGLYAEQLSGSPFTAPHGQNERSWLYRRKPSTSHVGKFKFYDLPLWRTAPNYDRTILPLGQYRWDPTEIPTQPTNFIQGIRTVTVAGDVNTFAGMATHVYACNESMADTVLVNADGELLIVPQEGGLSITTEMGRMLVEPGSIAVIPRGVKTKVFLTGDHARGYICENYGGKFTMPDRGPIGANCLANPRDFKTPVAHFEIEEKPHTVIYKWCGTFYKTELEHTPMDVVAWHGNYAPYMYDLSTFSPVGAIGFDHPDPSIFTVLTSPSETPGTGNVDFVIFPPRWMVAEDTFRPPWFHRNIMSEFMGLIKGQYDAKEEGFLPGGYSLHNMMLPHGPDFGTVQKAQTEELKPVKIEDTMAFMFETRFPQHITHHASYSGLQKDYIDCWKGL